MRQPCVSHDARRCVQAICTLMCVKQRPGTCYAIHDMDDVQTLYTTSAPAVQDCTDNSACTVQPNSQRQASKQGCSVILAHSDALQRPCSAAVVHTQAPTHRRRPPLFGCQTWLLDSSPARLELLDT